MALALLPVTLLPGATRDEVLARLRAVRDATDYTASGRLVRISPAGERKSCAIAFRAHAFPDGLRMFCEVTAPAEARVRMLLFIPPHGSATIRRGHAGDRDVKNLPTESWDEGVLGTDFTYEDLLENYTLWQRQTVLREERYGERTCVILRSEPGPRDNSHYASATAWLDRDIYYPVKVEKVVRTSGEVKDFIYYGLREVRGVWSASQIECKVAGKPGSSLLIINRGAEKPRLDRTAFDPALLTKP
ncbi:MAG: outer membrane lipoprotein-sorting protein [Terriglobia bacterium]